jgi:hypothetical protein
MTPGRQRACQAERPSASAFSCSGVNGGAARMTLLPLTVKSVFWLGVSGAPAAAALPEAGAAAAFVAGEVLVTSPDCCADAAETPAVANSRA